MNTSLDRYTAAAARLLVSWIFIFTGIDKIMHWSGYLQFMASKGMPWAPLFLFGAIVVELGGGLALLLGFQVRVSAMVIFLFLIPTTLIFQNFWSNAGAPWTSQMIGFLKNLAIMGGLLAVAVAGPGALGVNSRRQTD